MIMGESTAGQSVERETATHRVFACERCSRRKQRCDRILPVCSPCRVTGSSCTTSEREKGIVQLPGHEIARKGYVTTLLERIAALERQTAFAKDDTPPPPTQPTLGSAGPEGSLPVPSPSGQGRAAPVTSGSHWPLNGDADMNMESLSMSAMAEPLGRAGEFLKQLSMPRIIAGVTETYGGNPEATTRVDSLWDGISKYIRNPLGHSFRLHVKPAEANKSLETYLDIVDFRYPRLPLAKVRSGFDAITAEREAKYKETLDKDPAHIFMAYMVLAIVPLISDNYPISQGSFVSIQLLGKCLKVLERVFRQEDGVDIIQCLHLLVIFSIHCSAAGSSWHLIGFAMNKCIGLGYHLEAPAAISVHSVDELEQRRWAFWACYLLDRLICAALGRPFSIEDRHITVSLPGKTSPWGSEMDQKEAFHIHLFRYARLMSSTISLSSHRGFDQALSRILHWRISSPPRVDISTSQPYHYQTSLFHTLMLRVAIHEVLKAYTFEESNADESTIVTHKLVFSGLEDSLGCIWDKETQMLRRIKLLDISSSVAISLNRTRMTGRHFLSLLTGYSAFSMALATLYHRLAMSSLHNHTQSTIPSAAEHRWHPSILLESNSDRRENIDEDTIVDMAVQKLDIVARQFPRMQEYKQTVETMRSAIASPASTDQTSSRLKIAAMNIGPSHLRKLGLVIWFRYQSLNEVSAVNNWPAMG